MVDNIWASVWGDAILVLFGLFFRLGIDMLEVESSTEAR
jgi:hypothetical protein